MVDEYDKQKLEKALQLINEVYNYNYGIQPVSNRLETIIKKVEYIIKEANKK